MCVCVCVTGAVTEQVVFRTQMQMQDILEEQKTTLSLGEPKVTQTSTFRVEQKTEVIEKGFNS